MAKRILVTGGTGTLGRAVVDWLTAAGLAVRATSRTPRRESSGALTAPEAPHGAVTWADWLAARYGGSEVGADDRG